MAAVVLLLALPGAAAAVPPTRVSAGGPPPSSAPAPGSATASLRACRTATDQAQRSATFVAEMTATPTSSRMELRLRLLTRSGWHSRFTTVQAAGLGVWQRALPGRNEFIYAKQVTNLSAPAQYRAVVSYRWLDAHGDVIRRAHRRSSICVQPDQTAWLAVTRLDITPDSAGDRYVVRIRNQGRTASDPFVVTLGIAGAATSPVEVPALPARRSAHVTVVAPACRRGSVVTVALTPAQPITSKPTTSTTTQPTTTTTTLLTTTTQTATMPTQPTATGTDQPATTNMRLPTLPVAFSCLTGPQPPATAPSEQSTTRQASQRSR